MPALVDPALFDAVQEQLEENKRRARIPEKGSRYLLQGLLVCAKCGYANSGEPMMHAMRITAVQER